MIKRKPLPHVSVQGWHPKRWHALLRPLTFGSSEYPMDTLHNQSHVSPNSDMSNIHEGQHNTSANGDDSSETPLESENVSCNAKSAHSMWNPIWLSKTCLMCFATSFLVLALAIVTIYVVSVKRSGLVTQTYSNRYSWTYGPTAGLSSCLYTSSAAC